MSAIYRTGLHAVVVIVITNFKQLDSSICQKNFKEYKYTMYKLSKMLLTIVLRTQYC